MTVFTRFESGNFSRETEKSCWEVIHSFNSIGGRTGRRDEVYWMDGRKEGRKEGCSIGWMEGRKGDWKDC